MIVENGYRPERGTSPANCGAGKKPGAGLKMGTFLPWQKETQPERGRSAKRLLVSISEVEGGGATGTNKTKKWSSWSPGRFELPENDADLKKELDRARELQKKRPHMEGGTQVADRSGRPVQPERRAYTTCGNCQLICWGNKKETAQNVRMLHDFGCVIQDADGTLRALQPKEAEQEFRKMEPAHRSLYS